MATPHFTRREWLAACGSMFLLPALRLDAAGGGKALRGAFMILSTPYTDSNQVDHATLAREVDFLDRCGVQGIVWPQNTSEYPYLSREEHLKGLEVVARAARGKAAALVLGVQGPNTAAMLELARKAESLEPDAMIAMPPTEASSLDDYRNYFRALCRLTRRPIFIQTTGGAEGIEPTVDFIVELAREFPHFAYIKEEYQPIIPRMIALGRHRPRPIKGVFSGTYGLGWPYEMRLGFDGTMTGGTMYADIYARLWELHQLGRPDDVRDLFSRLLLMLNLDDRIPGVRLYVLKRRGIFQNTRSRRGEYAFSPEAVAEIEHNLAAIAPYLKVPLES